MCVNFEKANKFSDKHADEVKIKKKKRRFEKKKREKKKNK